MRTPHFPISSQRKRTSPCTSGATSASLGTLADSDTLDCHSPPAKKRRVFDFKDLCDPEDDQQQSRNELAICQPEWEWEREEMGITNGNGKGMGIKLG